MRTILSSVFQLTIVSFEITTNVPSSGSRFIVYFGPLFTFRLGFHQSLRVWSFWVSGNCCSSEFSLFATRVVATVVEWSRSLKLHRVSYFGGYSVRVVIVNIVTAIRADVSLVGQDRLILPFNAMLGSALSKSLQWSWASTDTCIRSWISTSPWVVAWKLSGGWNKNTFTRARSLRWPLIHCISSGLWSWPLESINLEWKTKHVHHDQRYGRLSKKFNEAPTCSDRYHSPGKLLLSLNLSLLRLQMAYRSIG